MENSPRIAIIGAGISGLAAAKELYMNGLKNIVIFEASDRIGGRIHTLELENGFIELGAQWIHGEVGNSIYKFASSKNLANVEDFSEEGKGTFCNENGDVLNCDLLNEMIAFLDSNKRNMIFEEFSEQNSVHNYFEKKFCQFLQISSQEKDLSDKEICLLKKAFRWFILFELIDNSCDTLHTLSPLSYTEWEDCDGTVELINPRTGYKNILDSLIYFEDCSDTKKFYDTIRFNTPVQMLKFCQLKSSEARIKLFTFYDNFEYFNHAIVTCSLGYLKENFDKFFSLNWSSFNKKKNIIEKLGYGTINKIFLRFSQPFWNENEQSFQIIWSEIEDEHSYLETELNEKRKNEISKKFNDQFPEWAYSIQSFDRVRTQPNMLMAWIGGEGAIQMEQYSNEHIANVCYKVLTAIVPKEKKRCEIGVPQPVYVTRWHLNPYMRGAYSNRTIPYERMNFENKSKSNIECLQMPIFIHDLISENSSSFQNKEQYCVPIILFAGEATDEKHYSTTHGAYDSGVREARRLLKFYKMI